MEPENISNIIKKIRKDNNLTQRDLANELNVTYQAVSKWENAKGIPDISTLKTISEKYHISLDNILDGNFVNKDSNSKRKKIIIGFLSILLLIGIVWLYFFIREKNDEAYLLKLKTNCQDFTLNGVLTNNGQKSAIHISNIIYCGKEIDETIYDEIECNLFEVHAKEKKLISFYNEKGEKKLQDYLTGITFNVNNYTRICERFVDDTILLEINATKGNKTVTYNIPLTIDDGC